MKPSTIVPIIETSEMGRFLNVVSPGKLGHGDESKTPALAVQEFYDENEWEIRRHLCYRLEMLFSDQPLEMRARYYTLRTGRAIPNVKTIDYFCRLFQVDPDWLVFGYQDGAQIDDPIEFTPPPTTVWPRPLRVFMRDNGLRFIDMSRLTGLHYSNFSSIFSAVENPKGSFRTVWTLSKCLNLTLKKLFYDVD